MDRPGAMRGRPRRRWVRHSGPGESGQDLGRMPELDAVRGLAVLAVISAHVNTALLPYAWSAVDLFFVLSGYLITSIILRNCEERGFLARFYLRRGLRIWPIYFLTVAAVVGLRSVLPRPYRIDALPYVLTYTQNVQHYWFGAAPQFSPYLLHTWSLAIEEQFYLLWPALVMLVGRRRVIPLALVVVSVSLLTRACGLHWWVLAARSDGLALGGLLAALRPEGEHMPNRRRSLTSGLSACAALGGLAALAITIGLKLQNRLPYPAPSALILAVNVLWFGLVGLAVCHSGHPALWLLRGRRLRSVGVMSYGLYLYHYVVLLIADDIAQKLGMHGRPLWREALSVAVCFALAALSWHYIERPILALKDRVPYRSVPIPSATLRTGRRNSTVEQG